MARTLVLHFSALFGSVMMTVGACYITPAEENYRDPYGPSSGGGQCEIGDMGCPCTSSGLCNEGFECIASINSCVVSSTCPVGQRGCACTEGGACDAGNICKESYCVSDAPCLPDFIGTEACQCTRGGGCDPGLSCLSSVCVSLPETGGSGSVGTTSESYGPGESGYSTGVPSETGESTTGESDFSTGTEDGAVESSGETTAAGRDSSGSGGGSESDGSSGGSGSSG